MLKHLFPLTLAMVFGAQAMSHLSKLTIVLMAIFFALTLVLAVLSGHKGKVARSLVEAEPALNVKQAAPEAPAMPAAELPAKPVQDVSAPVPAAKGN